MEMLSVIGIIIAVLFIGVMVYRGSVAIFVAPVAAAIICLFSGISLKTGLISTYAPSFGSSAGGLFLTICTCTLFGAVMTESQCAQSIAKKIADILGPEFAPVVVVLVSFILTAGGMSVGAYLVVGPIALMLFSKANYSKDLIIAGILAPMWTVTLTTPLIPSLNNQIVSNFLGTDPNAGLIPGLAAGVFMLIFPCVYLQIQARVWRKKGRGFADWDELATLDTSDEASKNYPNPVVAILPIVLVLIVYNVMGLPLPFCMILGSLLGVIIGIKKHSLGEWFKACEKGFGSGIIVVANVGAMGALGSVIALTPVFKMFTDWLNVTSLHPYIIAVLATTVMGACLGSASGALNTTLTALAPFYQNVAAARGLDLGVIGRMSNLGSIALDALPNSGGILAAISLNKTTYKKSYGCIFVSLIVNALIATFAIALPLALLGF